MSWNAYLIDDRGHTEGDWNYTHNCNGMIEATLSDDEVTATGQPFWAALGNTTMGRGAWWDLLNGRTGAEGAQLLDRIITGLEADPDRFRAMDPPNGWGSYDTLLDVLRDMRARVPEWPTKWEVNG